MLPRLSPSPVTVQGVLIEGAIMLAQMRQVG